jgi:DNA-binding CsgD family transcriptional regulator
MLKNGLPLTENDYEGVQGLIDLLQNCTTRDDLKTVFKFHILPLLNAHSAVYAWKDPDFKACHLIDSVNIPPEDIPAIQRFINHDPRAQDLLTHARPLIARDLTWPADDDPCRSDLFLREEPENRPGYEYFSLGHKEMITLAFREPSFGAGIHRRPPAGEPWSLRDVRIGEQLRPHLVQTVKSIVLTEKLALQTSFANLITQASVPVALLTCDLRVTFRNPRFADLLGVEVGQKLPPDMTVLMRKSTRDHDTACEITDPEFHVAKYRHPLGNFRLSFTRLEGAAAEDMKLWVLRMEPEVEDHMNMNLLIQKAGLTGREMETCHLVRQGIDDTQIAHRLFISPHTVKTHIKRIYEKLGVHSRAQLVATLSNNPSRFL